MYAEQLFVILIAIGVGAFGQLAYLFFVNHDLVRESKRLVKEIRMQMKGVQVSDPRFKEMNQKLMSENMKIMKQTSRPTFITFVPFLIVFIAASYFFNYAPIALNTPVIMSLSGSVNGSLSSIGNCVSFGSNSSQITLFSNTSSYSLPVSVHSPTCYLLFSRGTISSNASLSGLIGATQPQTYQLNGVRATLAPNQLIVFNLPFSMPLIGDQLNWFWTYLIFSFATSIILNRLLIRWKLIA